MIKAVDTKRFGQAIRRMCAVLPPRRFDEDILGGYWLGLRDRCTIDELEQAITKACQTLEWAPTPAGLLGIVKELRPRQHFKPDEIKTARMPEEIRVKLEQLFGQVGVEP